MRAFGLRIKRHVYPKEVIIDEPHYRDDAAELALISKDILDYSRQHKLRTAPNVVNVFFRYAPDHAIERISERLEAVIDDLSNTRDRQILVELNSYPYLAVKAHTRPFERKWLNVAVGVFLPTGVFFYIRMWRFRLRLLRDLRDIRQANANVVSRIEAMG